MTPPEPSQLGELIANLIFYVKSMQPVELAAWLSAFGALIALPSVVTAWALNHLKIGHKVAEEHAYWGFPFDAPGLEHVTLTNLKDRPTPISALMAVRGNAGIPLIEYRHPLILAPLHTLRVDIPPVLRYDLEAERYIFDSKSCLKMHIYYLTMGKWKRCVRRKPMPGLPKVGLLCRRETKLVQISNALGDSHLGTEHLHWEDIIYLVKFTIAGHHSSVVIHYSGLISKAYVTGLEREFEFRPVSPEWKLRDPQATADALFRSLPGISQLSVRKMAGWHRRFDSARDFVQGLDDASIEARRKPFGEAEREAAGMGDGAGG
ncbi:hypothetical protein [Achromobacter animicus]|uniref:hypothetical protein n=1 Tax=Achromobacter animicus TaxID=1389935 RepID=UPI0028AA8D35|nr:hypothetical protein [Achromobacter animicus]